MKKYLKVALIYCLITTAVTITFATLSVFLGTWIGVVGGYVSLSVILLALFHIGRIISNKTIRKRYFIYVSIFVGGNILFHLLPALLGIGARNTWFALIGANIMFLAFLIMVFDIARLLQQRYEKVALPLRVVFFFGVLSLIMVNIMFVVMG